MDSLRSYSLLDESQKAQVMADVMEEKNLGGSVYRRRTLMERIEERAKSILTHNQLEFQAGLSSSGVVYSHCSINKGNDAIISGSNNHTSIDQSTSSPFDKSSSSKRDRLQEDEPQLEDEPPIKRSRGVLGAIVAKVTRNTNTRFSPDTRVISKKFTKSPVATWLQRLQSTNNLETSKEIGRAALEDNAYLRNQSVRLSKDNVQFEKQVKLVEDQRDAALKKAEHYKNQRDLYRAESVRLRRERDVLRGDSRDDCSRRDDESCGSRDDFAFQG